jgi:hypothetical protein
VRLGTLGQWGLGLQDPKRLRFSHRWAYVSRAGRQTHSNTGRSGADADAGALVDGAVGRLVEAEAALAAASREAPAAAAASGGASQVEHVISDAAAATAAAAEAANASRRARRTGDNSVADAAAEELCARLEQLARQVVNLQVLVAQKDTQLSALASAKAGLEQRLAGAGRMCLPSACLLIPLAGDARPKTSTVLVTPAAPAGLFSLNRQVAAAPPRSFCGRATMCPTTSTRRWRRSWAPRRSSWWRRWRSSGRATGSWQRWGTRAGQAGSGAAGLMRQRATLHRDSRLPDHYRLRAALAPATRPSPHHRTRAVAQVSGAMARYQGQMQQLSDQVTLLYRWGQ